MSYNFVVVLLLVVGHEMLSRLVETVSDGKRDNPLDRAIHVPSSVALDPTSLRFFMNNPG